MKKCNEEDNPNRIYYGSWIIYTLYRIFHITLNTKFLILVVICAISCVCAFIVSDLPLQFHYQLIFLILWTVTLVFRISTIILRFKKSYWNVKYNPPPFKIGRTKSITVIQPLCGDEGGSLGASLHTVIRAVQCSHFKNVEIIYSIEKEEDPAMKIAQKFKSLYKNSVDIKIVMSGLPKGRNAKLNNTYTAYEQASYDWLLLLDSNIRIDEDFFRYVAPHLDDKLSPMITTTINAYKAETVWGNVFRGYMNSFFANCLVGDFVFMDHKGWWGKCGILRKSALETVGGLYAFRNCFNEDSAMGWVMQEHGYPVQFLEKTPNERIGHVSFSQMFSRFVRWGIIRRLTAPVAFIFEIFFQAITHSVIGGIIFQSWKVFAINMLYYLITDWITCGDIVHWLLKEIIYYPAWVTIWFTHTVKWRGQVFSVNSKSMLDKVTKED